MGFQEYWGLNSRPLYRATLHLTFLYFEQGHTRVLSYPYWAGTLNPRTQSPRQLGLQECNTSPSLQGAVHNVFLPLIFKIKYYVYQVPTYKIIGVTSNHFSKSFNTKYHVTKQPNVVDTPHTICK